MYKFLQRTGKTFTIVFIFISLAMFVINLKISPAQTTGQQLNFSDVPEEHWAFETVNQLAAKKLIVGYPDKTFRPENNLSRAEFAALLTRVANLPVNLLDKPTHQDVDLSAWYAPVISSAYTYIDDYTTSEGRLFEPAAPIIREQAIAAFLRVKQTNNKTPVNPNILSVKFKDFEKITASLQNMIAWAVEQGLVAGYDDGTFRPQEKLTRAEAAALVVRMFLKAEQSLETLIKSGKLPPLSATETHYEKLVDELTQNYPVITVKQTPVKIQYFAADLSLEEMNNKKILFVFAAIDPFKYFTFSDVDFRNQPDAVIEFNEAIMRKTCGLFPEKQVIVTVGYANTVYYDPSSVYDKRYVSYYEQERVWKIVRYYTGIWSKNETVEKWIETSVS